MKKEIRALNEVARRCRPAGLVYLALLEFANESKRGIVFKTRVLLARKSGVQRLRTISTALHILEDVGWIKVRRKLKPYKDESGASGFRMMLRIQMRRNWKTISTRATRKQASN